MLCIKPEHVTRHALGKNTILLEKKVLLLAAAAHVLRIRCCLDRLTAGTDIGNHRADELDLDAVSNLDLNFRLILKHLGYLGDKPPGSNDYIATTDSLQHFTMFLGLALLRPDHQEVHDDEDKNKRKELYQGTAGVASGCLCICGRNQAISPCMNWRSLSENTPFRKEGFSQVAEIY